MIDTEIGAQYVFGFDGSEKIQFGNFFAGADDKAWNLRYCASPPRKSCWRDDVASSPPPPPPSFF
jgi:hypothetical protein